MKAPHLTNRTKKFLGVVLAAVSFLIPQSKADDYTVPGSNGVETFVPMSFTGLNASVDNVLVTVEITDTNQTISSLMLALAGNGVGPGNYAILSGAAFIGGSGIEPTTTQHNLGLWGQQPINYFFSVTYTFDPPLSYGQRSATLLLQYPQGFIAAFSPFSAGIFLITWDNSGGSAGQLIPATMLDPSVSMILSNDEAVVTWTGYGLQSSTNLSDWGNVATNNVIGNVTSNFPAAKNPCLFFRAVK